MCKTVLDIRENNVDNSDCTVVLYLILSYCLKMVITHMADRFILVCSANSDCKISCFTHYVLSINSTYFSKYLLSTDFVQKNLIK